MHKLIFISLLISFRINCMDEKELDENYEKAKKKFIAYFEPLSLKYKVKKFFDKNNIRPSEVLSKVVIDYTGGPFNERGDQLNRFLIQAIENHDLRMIRLISSLGANIIDSEVFMGANDSGGWACSPLGFAIHLGKFAIVKLLTELDASDNRKIRGMHLIMGRYFVEWDGFYNLETDNSKIIEMITRIRRGQALSEEIVNAICSDEYRIKRDFKKEKSLEMLKSIHDCIIL